jgi:hypothetical protein
VVAVLVRQVAVLVRQVAVLVRQVAVLVRQVAVLVRQVAVLVAAGSQSWVSTATALADRTRRSATLRRLRWGQNRSSLCSRLASCHRRCALTSILSIQDKL